MKTDNIIVNKSKAFSLRIINLNKYLCNEKKEYVMSTQLLKSGTSIGANVEEAQRGQSKADFTAKLQIALKECYEAEYWLELMQKAELLPEEVVKMYLHDCGSIRHMLIASINTIKESIK